MKWSFVVLAIIVKMVLVSQEIAALPVKHVHQVNVKM